jgi:hypothetical protein
MRGELPEPSARLFVAGALGAWLANGGDLERDYFRVKAPKGSHFTPARLIRMRDESAEGGHASPSSIESAT